METVRPTRKVKLLLGFLVKGEADAIFKQNLFSIPQVNADPIQLWRRSADAVLNLPITPGTPEIRILEDAESRAVGEVRARQTFKKHYESFADYQFAMVGVNSLLTPQSFADIDYIDELSGRIGGDASLEEQIRFAMAEGEITEPIITGAHVIFTSQRRDLHVEQIPTLRQLDTGEFEIVIRASSRPNYVQAVKAGNRLLLTNGVHKVCAMIRNGYAHVPCLLRHAGRLEESGLNMQQSSLFRPDLLNGLRPAQIIDFLDERVSVSVALRSMYQVLRVGIGVEMFDVPAIPPLSATRALDANLDLGALATSIAADTTASARTSP